MIFYLARQDIAYQLAKLDGITGAGEALVCHAGIMARKPGRLKAGSRRPETKLYHYQA